MWGARQHPHGANGKMRAKEQRRRREQWCPRAKATGCTRFQRYRGRLFYAFFCLSACHCFRNHCRRNGSCHKSTYTKLLRMVDPCVRMCLVCFGRRFRKHCPGGYNPALVKDIWLVVLAHLLQLLVVGLATTQFSAAGNLQKLDFEPRWEWLKIHPSSPLFFI